jgi:hypothetical protein
MPVELIKFNNIKLKYYLNEDILLEYVLNAEVSCIYQTIQLSCNYYYRISDIYDVTDAWQKSIPLLLSEG